MITELVNILKVLNTNLENFHRIDDELLIDLDNQIIVKLNKCTLKENMLVVYDNSNKIDTKIYNRMSHTIISTLDYVLRNMQKCGCVPVIATSDFCIIKR